MDSEEKTENFFSGKSTLLFVDIISVVIIIIYLLVAIFYFFPHAKIGIDRRKKTASETPVFKKEAPEAEKEKGREKNREEALKKIRDISYFSNLYANKDFKRVSQRLAELIDRLRDHLKSNPVSDFELIKEDLTVMTEQMEDFITENHSKIRDKEKELLVEKLESLKTGFYAYKMEQVSFIDDRIDRLIELLKKKNERSSLSKVIPETKTASDKAGLPKKTSAQKEPEPQKLEKEIPKGPVIIARKPMPAAPAPRKTPQTVKPVSNVTYMASSRRYSFDGQKNQNSTATKPKPSRKTHEVQPVTEQRKPQRPQFSVSDIITTDEIITGQLTEKSRVFGKTLCVNRKDTTHFLSNQVLIKLVDVNASGGVASLDITHPKLGWRRFADMETGTRRPFEFGRRIYFFELLKAYGNCADVAIYEREDVY